MPPISQDVSSECFNTARWIINSYFEDIASSGLSILVGKEPVAQNRRADNTYNHINRSGNEESFSPHKNIVVLIRPLHFDWSRANTIQGSNEHVYKEGIVLYLALENESLQRRLLHMLILPSPLTWSLNLLLRVSFSYKTSAFSNIPLPLWATIEACGGIYSLFELSSCKKGS